MWHSHQVYVHAHVGGTLYSVIAVTMIKDALCKTCGQPIAAGDFAYSRPCSYRGREYLCSACVTRVTPIHDAPIPNRHLAGEGRDSRVKRDENTHTSEVTHTKIVTINLPEPFLAALEKLTEYGLYPSRSEAIRVALRDFLSKELQIAQKLKEVHEEMKTEKEEERRVVATAF